MKTKHTVFTFLIVLITGLSLCLSACNREELHDYSQDDAYRMLFSETDNTAERDMKNRMIAHIASYNRGDAETFYALFDMEKEDYQFNVAQMKSILANCKITYTPEEIRTAFINEDNAQAMLTMTCKGEDVQTGEILYYYRTDITYTLRRDGEWKIITQENSGEFDLMDTLDQETETE